MRGRWKYRASERELMEDPAAEEELLFATVRQFAPINRLLSRSRTLIRRHILDDAARRGLSRYTVLDLGAGGCDIAEWLVAAADSRGASTQVICLDSDPRIAAYARRRVAGTPNLQVLEASAEEVSLVGPVDYIFANHFLHHLTSSEILDLLPILREYARYGVVLNDLKRSRLSYVGFSIVATLFFRKSFAFYDGRLSIRRGFRRRELEQMVSAAGLSEEAEVRALFPGRLAVIWRPPESV
ncbi:MAG: methyltransferase domain-containing protein [Alkalispirochaetaceae bacterium]